MSKAVFTFGRMNPPTIGHEKLVNKVRAVARMHKGDPLIYLSHTHKIPKDPIEYQDKVKLAKRAFGNIVKISKANTIIKVMQELEKKYDEVVLVVGSDRVEDFKQLLRKYNGKDYSFDTIDVVSAGERDPDADDVSGMSASKMRELASNEDLKAFKEGLPRNLQRDAENIMKMVRKGLNYEQYKSAGYASIRDPERDQ
jgi:nicotinic acid mononucleotide adenylyltransferase